MKGENVKIKLGVIFGGRSVEHEISVVTAVQAMNQIDSNKYEVIPIYVTKDLVWYTGGMLRYIDSYKDFDLIKRYAKRVNLLNKNGRFVLQSVGLFKREINELDLAFPMMHGSLAEDGSIQGYLDLIGIGCVGANLYASAICQDKVFSRQMLENNGISLVNYTWLVASEFWNNKEEVFQRIASLKYPLIIKPSSLGSSVGIEIVRRKEELDSALERVIKYDDKVIVEEFIEDIREFNCAVMKSVDKVNVSGVEEIVNEHDFREYLNKFLWDNDDQAIVKSIYPADISSKLKEEIQDISLECFRLLNSSGIFRVDFIYDKKAKKLYVDEIESLPVCFSHHLWEETNILYRDLLDYMIMDAIKKVKRRDKMSLTIDSDILKKITTKNIGDIK